MKLTNLRMLGRFQHKETKQQVNLHKGQRVGRGTDVHFYLRSGKRVLVSEQERYSDWQLVLASQNA